jgi:uncharacterized protein YbjT (DUF2867 family)
MANQPAKKVLVTGATGQQGGATARILLQRGHKVRALTRNPESAAARALAGAGAQLTKGTMEDSGSLIKAAEGVDTVFAVTTPFEAGMDAETNQGKSVADAARSVGAHLVYTSVGWADQNTGIPHFESKWKVEQHIRSIEVPHSILGPAFFMENATSPMSLPALKGGTLALPMPARTRLPQIAVHNIADMAVLAIENPGRIRNRRLNIAGDSLTGDEAKTILSRVIGREINYFEVGMEHLDADLRIMFEWYTSREPQVDLQSLRAEFPEVKWLSYEDWARQQNWDALLS